MFHPSKKPDSFQSPAQHAKAVHLAATAGAPRDLVARSWIRCLNDYGLDPARSRESRVVSSAELRARTERIADLVVCAKLEMANLYQQLADTHTAVVLTDADGVILSVVGDPRFTKDAARMGLREGAVWSEAEQGTNGMGTCLAEKEPVIIHRDQHFCAGNISLTCTAAPIFDSHGRLAAVLDVSSQSDLPQQHSVVLVGMSAQMIENRALLANHRDDYIIRFHSRPEFVYTLHEGELALTGVGRVVAANRSALFQLGAASFDELKGADIRQLFNTGLIDLVSRTAASSFHPVALYGARQGNRFFAVAQQPERAAKQVRVIAESKALPAGEEAASPALTQLDYGDARMAHNVRCAMRVLNRDISILLCGETGTGKDLFARSVHAASNRAAGPFVAVNCASLPETLIESELFGYRSGAFTGASREGRRGKILQANGGTLFLDEIGDMPTALQARLLRVLEDRVVVPLGGEAPVSVDIQLISATHHDLREMVSKGEFREDLYYRLQGIVLTMPPLRERADKRVLIRHALLEEAGGDSGVAFDEEALRAVEAYDWPGNIRHLRNVLRTAVALCEDKLIRLRDLPEELRRAPAGDAHPADTPEGEARLNCLESAERDALMQELERHRWNISSLAQQLKTSRNTIYRKMKRLNIPGSDGGKPARAAGEGPARPSHRDA